MKTGLMRIGVMLVIGIWFGLPHNGFSETTTQPTAAYTLGEVVVSGKKPVVESVATVREITDEDISRRNARTLDQALKLLPGIDIRTATDGVARVDLRGFRSRHVLLLLNGIPFNSAFDGQFDPSLIPVENIARIKVSYGNNSVLYGQGGLGGVINIITKKGAAGLRGSAKLELGDRGRFLQRLTVSGAQNQFDAFAGGSVQDSDGFALADDFTANTEEDGGLRENSDKKHQNLFANFGYAPSDILQVGVVVNTMEGKFGKPPIAIPQNEDTVYASNPKYVRVENYDGFSGQLSMNCDLPGPLGLRGWLFTNQYEEDENQYDNNQYQTMNKKNSYMKNDTTKINGGTLQVAADLQTKGLFTVALSAEEQTYESIGLEEKNNNTPLVPFSYDYTLKIYSTALEYEVVPLDRFGLVFGYSHHWLEKDDGSSDDDNGFLAGAHYDVFENTRIRGSVARKIRFPSIRQLYEDTTGDPNLTPEKSNNYELGIEQRLFERTTLSLTGFYIDVKDYIEKITTTFENNDEYRFQGIELTAETRNIQNLLLRAGYTFMDTKDKSPGSGKDELQYRPEHKLTFESQYVFDFGLSIYASILHTADQYYYSKNAPYQKRKLGDYTLVNIKLNQTLKKQLDIYVGVDNLFDRDYEESYGFPRPGRTVYAGAEFRF